MVAELLTAEQLERGCKEFQAREGRDAIYKVATFLVGHYWGRPEDMANGLGILLLIWNQAHYHMVVSTSASSKTVSQTI